MSTGGTRKILLEKGLEVSEVSKYTNSPELLGGRVKTLHPKIYAGLLARRGDESHVKECSDASVKMLNLVVVNLYPFRKAVSFDWKDAMCDKGEGLGSEEECVGLENIDIGGVTLIRATAKNFHDTVLLTSPSQYQEFMDRWTRDGGITLDYRWKLALEGFRMTSSYDRDISEWLSRDSRPLKYGLNPHQSEAWAKGLSAAGLRVLGGKPGYINLLDAFQGFRLVSTVWNVLGMEAACSMKHTSPAGVGLGRDEYPDEVNPFFGMSGSQNDRFCRAYARARNSDPRSSFGDFICVNGKVEEGFAKMVKSLVSDGIIATGYSPEALALLSSKKGGGFIILEMPLITEDRDAGDAGDAGEAAGNVEGDSRGDDNDGDRQEMVFNGHRVVLSQSRVNIDWDEIKNRFSETKNLSKEFIEDCIMGMISILYTQSNSVGLAYRGQMIGIGAGQQSRIDCVALACQKARVFLARQRPEAMSYLQSLSGKRQDRLNSLMRWAEEGDGSRWSLPQDSAKTRVSGLVLISDAFFPFRDNIDLCAKSGVEWIVQPGGSVQDESVFQACQEYGIGQTLTGVRLFWH